MSIFRRRRGSRGSSKSYDEGSFPALILAATDEMCLTLDWSRVMAACDKAGTLDNEAEIEEGIRMLRKRIQEKQHRVVMHGLAVAESLVKNCSKKFSLLKYIAGEKFMKSMAKLVTVSQTAISFLEIDCR